MMDTIITPHVFIDTFPLLEKLPDVNVWLVATGRNYMSFNINFLLIKAQPARIGSKTS